MDTHFKDKAFAKYQQETGDTRPWDLLPPSIQSAIIQDAQKIKAQAPLTIDDVLRRTR
jgi:hypothetical protein